MKLLSVLACAALLGACAPWMSERAQPEPPPSRGQLMAESYCASCHALAHGESPHPEAPPLRTLSRRYPVRNLEEAFAEGAIVGHPAMPQYQFQPDEIDDLLGYLESIQEQP